MDTTSVVCLTHGNGDHQTQFLNVVHSKIFLVSYVKDPRVLQWNLPDFSVLQCRSGCLALQLRYGLGCLQPIEGPRQAPNSMFLLPNSIVHTGKQQVDILYSYVPVSHVEVLN